MSLPDLRGAAVLVTGGAGFIGSHLVAALASAGARVRVLDNLETGRREHLAGLEPGVELLVEDLRDADACKAACRGIACVFHLAALGSVPLSWADPATTLAVNLGGTANLLAAASESGVERVVYASSSGVYGAAELPHREGAEAEPLSPYAASKRMAEELAGLFQRRHGLRTVGLRYFNVYGPRQDPDGPYAAVVPRFLRAGLRGEVAVIHGDGEQSRDFTFVDDAVRATLLAAAAPDRGPDAVYNVATGRGVTVRELAAIVRRLFGGGPPPEHAAPRPGEVRHSVADLSAARAGLGYEPRIDLETGLARTLDHYRAAAL